MSRKIFIDCGAHKATSLKFFCSSYPNSQEYETHSFEIYPDFKKHFDHYVSDGSNKHFFYNKAVWIKDETIKFWKMDQESSTVGPYTSQSNSQAEGVDFSKWLLNNFEKHDSIVLKMDIEGAEFSVLPKMFDDGSIELIDKLFIEFHYGKRQKTSLELSLSILEDLIFKYKLEPFRWDATGKDKTLDKIDLDWRVCRDLEKEKADSDLGKRWQKIKDYFKIEKWKKGMAIYSPNKGE